VTHDLQPGTVEVVVVMVMAEQNEVDRPQFVAWCVVPARFV
jgi:hypothetical protein